MGGRGRPNLASHGLPLWPPTLASHFGLPLWHPTSASHFGLALWPPNSASHFGLALRPPMASQFGLPIRPLTASHCLARSPTWPPTVSHMASHGLPIRPYGRLWEAEVGGRSGRLKWEAKVGGQSGRPWEGWEAVLPDWLRQIT